MSLIRLRFPSQCELCGAWPRTRICKACLDTDPKLDRCTRCALPHDQNQPCPQAFASHEIPWVAIHASLTYKNGVAELIQRHKFRGEFSLAHALADWMCATSPVWLNLVRGLPIIPIPVTRLKLKQRGFNQSVELCKQIKKRKRLRGRICHVLSRNEASRQQSKLPAQARRDNMTNAFEVNPLWKKRPPTGCLLIDDVMTSGATLLSACQSLKQSGYWPIYVWVLARTPLPNSSHPSNEHRSGSP